MTTSGPEPGERVADVCFDDDTMTVDVSHGRTIIVPTRVDYAATAQCLDALMPLLKE